jgi:hypothetical protein
MYIMTLIMVRRDAGLLVRSLSSNLRTIPCPSVSSHLAYSIVVWCGIAAKSRSFWSSAWPASVTIAFFSPQEGLNSAASRPLGELLDLGHQ